MGGSMFRPSPGPALVLALALACGGDDAGAAGSSEVDTDDQGGSAETNGDVTGTDAGDAADTTETDDTQDSADGTSGGIECPVTVLAPGLHKFTFPHEGLERTYDVYVPASHDGTEPTPLVFNLHPLTLGGALHGIWTSESGMNDKAEEAGFVVVQPDGTGSPASWNAGNECCDPASANGVDDVGLVMALADHVATVACIDTRRIYAMGMSNGAYLSHRLACEESAFVAAIGPVVGSLSAELDCDLERAVPVIQISGSEDAFASREASFEAWRDMNGCTDEAEETYTMGDATCVTHDECDDGVEVTHCVMWGGGHCFFSDISPQLTPGCAATTDLNSPDMLWEFMRRFSVPQ